MTLSNINSFRHALVTISMGYYKAHKNGEEFSCGIPSDPYQRQKGESLLSYDTLNTTLTKLNLRNIGDYFSFYIPLLVIPFKDFQIQTKKSSSGSSSSGP